MGKIFPPESSPSTALRQGELFLIATAVNSEVDVSRFLKGGISVEACGISLVNVSSSGDIIIIGELPDTEETFANTDDRPFPIPYPLQLDKSSF